MVKQMSVFLLYGSTWQTKSFSTFGQQPHLEVSSWSQRAANFLLKELIDFNQNLRDKQTVERTLEQTVFQGSGKTYKNLQQVELHNLNIFSTYLSISSSEKNNQFTMETDVIK